MMEKERNYKKDKETEGGGSVTAAPDDVFFLSFRVRQCVAEGGLFPVEAGEVYFPGEERLVVVGFLATWEFLEQRPEIIPLVDAGELRVLGERVDGAGDIRAIDRVGEEPGGVALGEWPGEPFAEVVVRCRMEFLGVCGERVPSREEVADRPGELASLDRFLPVLVEPRLDPCEDRIR